MAKPTIAGLTAEAATLAQQLATARRAISAHEATVEKATSAASSAIARANSWQLMADDFVDPIIRALNVAAQAKAKVPFFIWKLIPATVREPIDTVFAALYTYQERVGQLRESFAVQAAMPFATMAPGHIEGLTSVPPTE